MSIPIYKKHNILYNEIENKKLPTLGGIHIYKLLKDEAYDRIVSLIDKGEIHYGEIYSLSWITSQLQMSRTPVRDAIHKLCDEHRLDVMPSRGFCLHQLNEEEYLGRFHYSNAVEGYCVFYLAAHYKEEPQKSIVEKMRVLQANLYKLYEENAPFSDFYECDNNFHLQLLQTLGEAFYNNVLSVQGLYNMPEIHETSVPISRKEILNCHDKILAAIDAQNPQEAYKALLEHSAFMYESYKKTDK